MNVLDPNQGMFDVAIIGFGPTGAVAAGLLAKQGIRTFVCDKQRSVYDIPRAIALDHEILRVFQNMGIDHLIAPYTEPFTDSVYYGVDAQVIKQMSTVAAPYPLSHTPSVVFSQPPVERVLRQHANSFSCLTERLGVSLLGLTQDDDCVSLTLKDEQDQVLNARARYVLGCDGASSSVRALAGLELEDLEFDEPWLVVDALINERGLAKLPNTSVQYCNPARPSTYVIGPGMHRRWEISLNEGEDPLEAATAKRTWELLAPWITPDDAQLWRQASYRFHALVAKEWRRERVFIAGDAAHQQPPFLGQGMCQGIRDAVNLSWRLNAVLRQGAPTRLLDSYASERAAHVRELTQRIKHIGKIITERDLDKARARDTKLLEECDGVVRPTPRQDVQPALSAGLLSSQIHPARGTLFPQPMVLNSQGQRVRMDEVYVPGWRIVLSQQASAKMIQIAQTGSASKWPVLTLGTPALTEVDAVLQTWFQTHSVCAAIVRPDHYVFGVSNDISELQTQLSELIPSVVPLFENTQENP